MKIDTILVPVDFSACSRNALQYAIDLAEKTEARLHLMHSHYQPVPTIDIPVALEIYPAQDEQMVLDSWKELTEQVPRLNKVNYTKDTHSGFLTDNVLQLLDQQPFDLIVMGTKGCSNKLDQLLGSNSYNIAKEAPVPVLVVPEGLTFEGYNHIALAADFQALEDLATLNIVRSLAESFDSEVHLLHISTAERNLDIEEAQEALNLNDFFQKVRHHFEFVSQKDIVEGIESYVAQNNINLTVLIPRHHNIWDRLFKQQVTRKTVLNANMNMLVLHEKA